MRPSSQISIRSRQPDTPLTAFGKTTESPIATLIVEQRTAAKGLIEASLIASDDTESDTVVSGSSMSSDETLR